MAWITTISVADARGQLATIYNTAIKRAGRVFNILSVMSLNPPVLESSMALYIGVMRGPSALCRRERELVAVVVSHCNACRY